MPSLQLELTSFDCVPADMVKLSELAAERGLSRSAFLRQMIADKVRRAERAEKENG
ncbi:MAG: ribbon-helix-helix protein, CopG family [Candidatus Acidiferrales bacterium]